MTINAKPHPLREYRVRESLTQDHLARLLGVSKAAVSRWENGERKPDQHRDHGEDRDKGAEEAGLLRPRRAIVRSLDRRFRRSGRS